jgi:hypothetical protein
MGVMPAPKTSCIQNMFQTMENVQQKCELVNCHCHKSVKNDFCDLKLLTDASLIYADHPVILFVWFGHTPEVFMHLGISKVCCG